MRHPLMYSMNHGLQHPRWYIEPSLNVRLGFAPHSEYEVHSQQNFHLSPFGFMYAFHAEVMSY